MSALSRAGATCLLAGPVAGLVSVLVERTLSRKTADLASAFTSHPGAAHLGLAINAVAVVLTAAGLIWFAWTTHARSPRLAIAGGILGVLGMFSALADGAFHLAGSLVVDGMSTAQATPLLGWLGSGGVPLAGICSELADIGVILLAIAALRIGVPRWGAGVIVVGALAEGIGFAAASRYLAAAGFVLTAVGYVTVVRTVFAPTVVTPAPLVTQPA